jgi:hypothetical protein
MCLLQAHFALPIVCRLAVGMAAWSDGYLHGKYKRKKISEQCLDAVINGVDCANNARTLTAMAASS